VTAVQALRRAVHHPCFGTSLAAGLASLIGKFSKERRIIIVVIAAATPCCGYRQPLKRALAAFHRGDERSCPAHV